MLTTEMNETAAVTLSLLSAIPISTVYVASTELEIPVAPAVVISPVRLVVEAPKNVLGPGLTLPAVVIVAVSVVVETANAPSRPAVVLATVSVVVDELVLETNGTVVIVAVSVVAVEPVNPPAPVGAMARVIIHLITDEEPVTVGSIMPVAPVVV
jgi:hypothetical protein